MVVNPLAGKSMADIIAMAKAKWASQSTIDKATKAVQWYVKPVVAPKQTLQPKNIFWDTGWASSIGANKATGVASTWLKQNNRFVYGAWAKAQETSTPWYLNQRNDQLAQRFSTAWQKDQSSIMAELSKDQWFMWATDQEKQNTVKAIMNRMWAMAGGEVTPTLVAPVNAQTNLNAGQFNDGTGNFVDILWYDRLDADTQSLIDWLPENQKKELSMLQWQEFNAKLEYLRQSKGDTEFLQERRAKTIQIKDLEGNVLEIQSSQRLQDAGKQLDNLIQNFAYLWSRWQPWTSSVRLWAVQKTIADAEQRFAEMKSIEAQVAQIRQLWLDIDTAGYEKQMADIADDLNMKVGMQIQNAMNEMTSADLAGQLDTIDGVTQFKRSLLERLDSNITGHTEWSMKQMQYVTEQYTKIADDAQLRLTERTTNSKTINTEMSAIRGVYVDGNGNALYNSDGTTIAMPETPPMPPNYDEKTGRLVTFSNDPNNPWQILANVQQVFAGWWAEMDSKSAMDVIKAINSWEITKQQALAIFPSLANAINAGWGSESSGYQWPTIEPVDKKSMDQSLMNVEATKKEWSVWGQCGTFVNDYLVDMGLWRLFIDPIDIRKTQTNSQSASVGSIAVFEYAPDANVSDLAKQFGHVAIVTSVNADWSFNTIESNKNNDKKVFKRSNLQASETVGFFDPTKWLEQQQTPWAWWNLKQLAEYLIDTQPRWAWFSDNDTELFTKAVNKYAERWDRATIIQLYRDLILKDKENITILKTSTFISSRISQTQDLMKQYMDSWKKMNIFNGSIQDVTEKLGESWDPLLVQIGQNIGMLTADYIRNISGTAAADKEVERLTRLLPNTSSTFDRNMLLSDWFRDRIVEEAESSLSISMGKNKWMIYEVFDELKPKEVGMSWWDTTKNSGKIWSTGTSRR